MKERLPDIIATALVTIFATYQSEGKVQGKRRTDTPQKGCFAKNSLESSHKYELNMNLI